MSETVIILGAGASKAAGAPLMNDFLDVAEDLERNGQAGNAANDFRLVLNGIAELQHAHSKAVVDLNNFESVFAAFEMAKLIGHLGSLTQEQVEKLPTAMRRVIETTIEARIKFPTTERQILAPTPYPRLAALVQQLARPKGRISLITFNYDLCVDYALYSSGVPVGYRLGPFKEQNLPLLKLHGSLNWGWCSVCKELVAWPLDKFFQNRRWQLENGSRVELPVASTISEFMHCQNVSVDGPYLVPPTWNKLQYHDAVGRVWRAAAEELATAENIFVCGYSLPDTDQFFRYLYALGTIGPTRLKRFWVFNPDQKVEQNFRGLLGQAASSRFTFFPVTFDQMLTVVASLFPH